MFCNEENVPQITFSFLSMQINNSQRVFLLPEDSIMEHPCFFLFFFLILKGNSYGSFKC